MTYLCLLPVMSLISSGVVGHWSFVRIVPGVSGVVTVCASWSPKRSIRF